MRAVLVTQYAPITTTTIARVRDPEPGPDEALVRVLAAGLGFVDGLKVQGLYQSKDPLPFIPGMEFAGVVEKVGTNSTGLRPGDRVFALVRRGSLAEKIVVPAREAMLMPQGMSFAQAAAVPVNYLTAAYALSEIARPLSGKHVLILGAAGGTGMAAIAFAKLLGGYVIAAASTEKKRSFVREQGADAVVDYTGPNWREQLKSLTNGRPIDVIFDPVGGDISPIAFRTLAWRGKHLVVGFAAGRIPSLAFNIPLLKGAALVGIDSAQIQKWEPETYARLFEQIRRDLDSGALAPPPVMTFPFERFIEAFHAISARTSLGKVVIEFEG